MLIYGIGYAYRGGLTGILGNLAKTSKTPKSGSGGSREVEKPGFWTPQTPL